MITDFSISDTMTASRGLPSRTYEGKSYLGDPTVDNVVGKNFTAALPMQKIGLKGKWKKLF